jgi:hypothetical protein
MLRRGERSDVPAADILCWKILSGRIAILTADFCHGVCADCQSIDYRTFLAGC